MTNGLLALEQSLTKRKRGKRKPSHKAEGLNVPPPAQLRQQIEVIQGRRVGQPSSNLRALEDRLLGNTPTSNTPNCSRLETQRLDHGQAPLPPSPASPTSTTITPNAPLPPQNAVPTAQSYAPEFSAPDTGRFHVESFNEPTSPEQLFQPAPAVSQPNPTPAQSPQDNTSARLISAPEKVAPQPALLDDSDNWINQNQQDQPQKISESSRNSLDASTALAKDDFEKDLAAILGHAPAQQTPTRQHTPQQTTQPAGQTPEQNPQAGDENAPPPHPSHDIFDQMGLGMQYANSFDLGEVNLQERFNQFDRELEQPKQQKPQSQALSNPFVSPMELDEFDLVAELAEISADYPELANAACAPQEKHASKDTTEQAPTENTAPHQTTAPAQDQQQTAAQAPTETITNNNQTELTAGEHHEQPTG